MLDIPNQKELESLLLDASYKNLMSIKLSQSEKSVNILSSVGRSVPTNQSDDSQSTAHIAPTINSILEIISQWKLKCDTSMNRIQHECDKLNALQSEKQRKETNFRDALQTIVVSKKLNMVDVEKQLNVFD